MVLDNADDESVFYAQMQHGRGAVSDGTRGRLTLANAIPQAGTGRSLLLHETEMLLRHLAWYTWAQGLYVRVGKPRLTEFRSIRLSQTHSQTKTSSD
jgi:hypothetical protein